MCSILVRTSKDLTLLKTLCVASPVQSVVQVNSQEFIVLHILSTNGDGFDGVPALLKSTTICFILATFRCSTTPLYSDFLFSSCTHPTKAVSSESLCRWQTSQYNTNMKCTVKYDMPLGLDPHLCHNHTVTINLLQGLWIVLYMMFCILLTKYSILERHRMCVLQVQHVYSAEV